MNMTARRACVILLIGVASLPGAKARAQSAPLIANVGGRETTSLNGQWRTIIDPYDFGWLDYRAKPITGNSAFFKNHKPQSSADLVEYDFDTSPELSVPGDWNTQRESLLFYEGSLWYKTSFDYARKANRRLFVHFGAANYVAAVYLNGEPLGQHEGGFTPFDFEITDRVKPTGNFLVVRVNNVRKREAVPTLYTDWWNYGGITRPVTLIDVADTFIQDYSIQLAKNSMDTVSGWVQLNGAKPQQKVRIRIPEANITQTVETNASGHAEFSFPAHLTLWSPGNPKLYSVEVASETDRVTDQIGFRSIQVKGTEILLNGKSIFLRGVSIHEESPLHPGRAWSEDDARTLLEWAKELGCNFVRLAHYPHNEAMLRMADRVGVMVWGEIPVYWTIQWENPDTLNNAKNQLSEMIARDHNRAALIIYSVANETPISDARNAFLRQLVQTARAQDPTRLLSAALQYSESKEGDRIVLHINDPVADDLDIMGDNEYIGWYSHTPADADRTDWKSDYNKPLIISEFGGDALFGKHGSADERWTEEYQENLYRHQLAMLSRIPYLRGMTPWILKDFRSPRRTLPNIQDYYNRKGLVSDKGDRKKAFYVLQEYYRRRAAAN